MKLISTQIAMQRAKRINRIDKAIAIANSATFAVLAEPTGFNQATGTFIATTADGGEIQYSAGNFRAQPSVISIVPAKNSLIGFGDWL